MNEENQSNGTQERPEPESGTSAQAAAEGYIEHVREVVTAPDAFFDPGTRSNTLFGYISMVAFLVLVLLESLFGRIARFSNWSFEFSYVIQALKTTLTIGIAIAAVLFVLNWQAGRGDGRGSFAFYAEKFGAALILPCLLLVLAIPLELLDITVHSWFRGAALILVYVAVFMMSYWYAAPKRLNIAVLFLLGFYFTYRLLLLLF
ncbi:MAG: hypothetical protein WD397_08825 [Wenzhouxiangellaceae bacterium]